ncbi:MAG: PAS domain S-box protein [Candidatus Desulfofervidaceae bacterium]|nr:PAS domain S-box protein [Candidatus Desulfofervidaceae bacterium]MDL1971217.1 ATP-binding protein [Candidatus Desulfofervidaceae bacterium]
MNLCKNDVQSALEVAAEQILAAIPNAVFATDKNMRIIYFNKIAEKITGFKEKEAIGMYCRDVFKTDLCGYQCLIERAFESGKNIFHVEAELTDAEGEKIPVLTNASVLRDKSGRITGYLVVFQDISDIKKTVEELRLAKRMLVEKNRSLRLAYKELELTQRQLLQAQKMESLGRLAGGFAHNFNNILCVILGYVSLLKKQLSYDKSINTYIDIIEKSTLKAADLTQKVLAFAQGGKYKIELVDVNKIIIRLVSVLKETLAENIQIDLELSPEILPVEADASQIYHALLNLCINARDAMPEGGKVKIKTERVKIPSQKSISASKINPGHYVLITVSDTGPGIKPEIQDKIFEPFFTTKGPDKGTGLGLAVVYGIVKGHHGHIKLESTPGKGTNFYIYLPVKEVFLQSKLPFNV